MAVDKIRSFYVTSDLGVQVLDSTCHPCGALSKPDKVQQLKTCNLGGPEFGTLYIGHGTKKYPDSVEIANGHIATTFYSTKTFLRDGYRMGIIGWSL